MSESPKGGELFIVDNSETDWKGLRYLQDWTEIARSFDIATGLFEIGSLVALDGKWQKLEGMGDPNFKKWLSGMIFQVTYEKKAA